MKTAFMVAEKPSLALALANILSNNNLKSRKGKRKKASFFHIENFVYLQFFPLCKKNNIKEASDWILMEDNPAPVDL